MESERPVLTSTYTTLRYQYTLFIDIKHTTCSGFIINVKLSTTRSKLQLGSVSFGKDNHSSTKTERVVRDITRVTRPIDRNIK